MHLKTKKEPKVITEKPQKKYNFQSPEKGWTVTILGIIIIVSALLWAKGFFNNVNWTLALEILYVVTAIFFVLLILKLGFFLIFSLMHYIKHRKKPPVHLMQNATPVTAILPCYNEALTLENAAKSMIAQSYKNLQVIIVSDGSTDDTNKIGERLAKKYAPKLMFLSKPNGGKASALNYGIKHATGDIVICMDADSVFGKDTVAHLASTFADPKVVGVAGNIKVSNSVNFWTRSQSIEWATGVSLQERAFAELGCMQVITGAVGAFRKSAVLAVGGYSSDTIVEDMDLTVSLYRLKGAKVKFNNWAVASTESPESFKDFYKQRYRWTYGRYEVLKKHKDMMFNPDYGIMGMFGLPYYLVTPALNLATAILFAVTVVAYIFTNQFLIILVYLGLAALVTILMGVYAVFIDTNHNSYNVSLYGVIQNMWYMYVIGYIDTKAWFDHAIGKKTKWNKVKRYGKNTVPA